MYEALSIFTASLGVGYFLYYFWYLSWPIVNGKVDSCYLHEIPSLISSKKKIRVINYKFNYCNDTYIINRQGLFLRFGFAPNLKIGDVLKIKVCPKFITLSCPERNRYNLFVMIFFQLFFMLVIAVFLTA